MASRSPKAKEAAAAKAMRQNYSAVSSAISHPDVAHSLASKLYDKGLVTKDVRNTVQLTRTLPPSQQATTLLADVESRISPQNLRRFVRVLKTEDALKPVAERLHQDYRTILSECGESESEDSEAEQKDGYQIHGYGTVCDTGASKSEGRDKKSDVKVNKLWFVALVVAVFAIVIAILVVGLMQPTDVPIKDDHSHKAHLQQLYLREAEDVPGDQWPPVKKMTYVQLAMVDVERVGDTVEDEFLRKTLRGSAGDILHHKEGVQFNELFDFEKGSVGARILIEGRPGSGKTTLMRKISRDWANGNILNDCTVFVVAHLRQLPGKGEITLEDLVGVVFPKSKVKGLVNDIEEKDGLGLCFALDGMDEHPAAASETGYIYRLFEKIELHKSCVIMSSRPSATIPFRKLASRYVEVIGFTSEAIDQYISEYYRDQPEKSLQLQKYLNDHLNVRNMCYLPVNLAINVWLFNNLEPGDSLPDRETGIYESFTIMYLVRHMLKEDKGKKIVISTLYEIERLSDEKFSSQNKESFYKICELAFQGRLHNTLFFSSDELPSVFTQNLGLLTTDQTVAQNHHGMEESYSFFHLTFQEFLASFHLSRLSPEDQVNLIQEHAKNDHCYKLGLVLKFYAGLSKLNSMEVFEHIMKLCQERISVMCIFEAKSVPASRLFVNYSHKSLSFKGLRSDANFDSMALGYTIAHNKEAIIELYLRGVYNNELATVLRTSVLSNLETLKLDDNMGLLWGKYGQYRFSTHDSVNLVDDITAGCCSHVKRLTLIRQFNDGSWIVALALNLTKVEKLELKDNFFTAEGAVAFGELLANGSWPNLRILDLFRTFIGDSGAVALAAGLRSHRQLEKLILSRNNIGDGGVAALATGLRNHPKLEELDLGCNRFGDDGVVELVEVLAAGGLPNLRILRLTGYDIGERGATALATGLRDHFNLERLVFRVNISNEWQDVLVDLQLLTTVEYVNVSCLPDDEFRTSFTQRLMPTPTNFRDSCSTYSLSVFLVCSFCFVACLIRFYSHKRV